MTYEMRNAQSRGSDTNWLPIPEGQHRFKVGKPVLGKYANPTYKNPWKVKFPLELIEVEQKALLAEVGELPEGTQQSYRTSYTAGLSFGYMKRDGSYKDTNLYHFVRNLFGRDNVKDATAWIQAGGTPEITAPSEAEFIERVEAWLEWFQDMEIFGTITHRAGDDGRIWADFGGPLPVGLPPQAKDPDYQNFGRGKLRAIRNDPSEASDDEPQVDTAAESVAGAHDPLTCKCEDCTEQLRKRAAEMFGSPAGAAA